VPTVRKPLTVATAGGPLPALCYPPRVSEAVKTRRQMLEEFLTANPTDAFARYGLALECVNSGDDAAAEDHFQRLLSAHPDYLYGYFHYGGLLSRLARGAEAQETLRQGIEAAKKAGDAHALSELEAALEESVASGE
jgi:tetratricopeptide (TPR) repeat protein